MRSFIHNVFHSNWLVSIEASVSTVSRIYFKNGVTFIDVVSVVILKIRTDRTGIILPDRTEISRSDLAGSFDPERDIFSKVIGFYLEILRSSVKRIVSRSILLVLRIAKRDGNNQRSLIGCFYCCSWSGELLFVVLGQLYQLGSVAHNLLYNVTDVILYIN